MNIPETLRDMARQEFFIREITQKLKGDSGVLAIWLEGSLARPADADRYSDVDLHVLVKVDAEETFRAGLSALLNEIQPVLYYRPLPFGPMMAMVLFENLLQLEVWVETGENRYIRADQAVVLYDVGGILEFKLETPVPAAEIDELLNLRIRDLWFDVSGLPKVARGELIPMMGHLNRQVEWLTEVILLGRGISRDVGGSRVTQALTDAEKTSIAEVLTLPEITPTVAIKAHVALADLLGKFGRIAIQQRGLEYPAALERVVLDGVRHELERLGLPWPTRSLP